MFKYIFLIGLSVGLIHAAEWKSSLNFQLNDMNFDQIQNFHHGLCDAEKEYSESKILPRKIQCGQGSCLVTGFDNIGNPVLKDPEARDIPAFWQEIRPPMNTSNTALGALQVIFGTSSTPATTFIPFQIDKTVRDMNASSKVRFFDSNSADKILKDIAKNRLKDRLTCPETVRSKPDQLEASIAAKEFNYHPHSEEQIIAYLVKNYQSVLQEALKAKPNDTSAEIVAIILHIHSQRDMCGDCAYIIDWELATTEGVAELMAHFCEEKNAKKTKPTVATLVSSRQNHNVWGLERRTLPKGPPPQNRDLKQATYANFQSKIDLTDKQRYFAQHATAPFLDPKQTENKFYKLGKTRGSEPNLSGRGGGRGGRR
jgi:hypothetical protein